MYKFRIKLMKILSLILYYLSGKYKKNKKEILKIKGIYAGRRAFVICNGPSLRASDLEKIADNGDLSIACNKIDRIFGFTKWRPTFYTIADENYQFSLSPILNNIPAKYKFFLQTSFIKTWKAKGNCFFLNCNGKYEYLEKPQLCTNIESEIPIIGTVTFLMIVILLYLGIREIIILGCDNTYAVEITKDGKIVKNNVSSYFEGCDKKDMQNAASTWQMNIAYKCIKDYANVNGIRIFNATRGGHLEEFERVDFDTLFNE